MSGNWTTRRQTNSPTVQLADKSNSNIAEIDILTFRLWEQGLISVPIGTDVLGDQKNAVGGLGTPDCRNGGHENGVPMHSHPL